MRSIKYKHFCPRHGIETCHCTNSANRHRLKMIHICTIESQGQEWQQDPLKFPGKRFVKDELHTERRSSVKGAVSLARR